MVRCGASCEHTHRHARKVHMFASVLRARIIDHLSHKVRSANQSNIITRRDRCTFQLPQNHCLSICYLIHFTVTVIYVNTKFLGCLREEISIFPGERKTTSQTVQIIYCHLFKCGSNKIQSIRPNLSELLESIEFIFNSNEKKRKVVKCNTSAR